MKKLIPVFVILLFFIQSEAASGFLEMEDAIKDQYEISLGSMIEMSDSAYVAFGGPRSYIQNYTRYDVETDQCLQRTKKNIGGESDVEVQVDLAKCEHLKNPLGFFQGRFFETKRLVLAGTVFKSANLLVLKRDTGERICAVTWGVTTSIRWGSVVYSVDPKYCQ